MIEHLLATIDLPKEWLSTICYIALSVVTAAVTVLTWLWRLIRRLEQVEADTGGLHELMTKFGADLEKHQQTDCDQLDKLHAQYGTLAEPVAKIVEAVDWIKKTLESDRTYVHERIAAHDKNNADQIAVIEKELARLGEDIKSNKPPKRRPSR